MNEGHRLTQETFRTRLPMRYRLGFLGLGVLVTVGIAWAMVTDGMNGATLVATLLGAVFLYVVLMQVTVRLEEREVSIKVGGIFATSIPYRQIDAVSPGQSTGIGAGMGLRMMPNGTTGYLVGGPSVRITTGRTAVVVSSNRPEELSQAIRSRSTSARS